MPSARHVSLVQKLRWHVSGNISPSAFAIGDVDGHGDNSFVIGNLVGDLFIFKGNHPEGLPWMTCKGLGTITAVAIGDIRNVGKNSIVVLSAEGLCHIFDIAGIDDEHENGHGQGHVYGNSSINIASGVPTPGQPPSLYSSTPIQGSYQQQQQQQQQQYPANSLHSSYNPMHPTVPATPNIRPVPDLHHHHHSTSHHSSHASFSGTPPVPPVPHNTPHGSSSSSISGIHSQHQTSTAAATIAATSTAASATSAHPSNASNAAAGGVRRGSEIFPGTSAASTRTSTMLSNLIGTPPLSSSSSHGQPVNSSSHHTRSIGGGNSNLNSPTGTPHLRPQHPVAATANSTRFIGSGVPLKDAPPRRNINTRHSVADKSQVQNIGGRRVLERPSLTLPVPVNINRAHIADIDGDGLNELVLARTDRILHSYFLQPRKPTSPTSISHPSNQPLSLMKLLSRTSSISTLDSSGLLSPSDERRDAVIHYPALTPSGRQYYSTAAGVIGGYPSENISENQENTKTELLTLVEKRRWALDGQIHSLSVTKDSLTGLPILLVAQPGLKFVMIDHTGAISEPLTQVQLNPKTSVKAGPDTPTRGAGGGDVATDIVCGSQYVNGQRKDIIGLMSMDGAFALHDLENNTVKVHDLDSTHKIFGFSTLNFGHDRPSQGHSHHHHDGENDDEDHHEHSRRSGRSKNSSGYGRSRSDSHCDDDKNDASFFDMPVRNKQGDEEEDDGGVHGSDNPSRRDDSQARRGEDDEFSDSEIVSQHGRRSSIKRVHQPSLLISEPFGSRFQMNDMFVGCSWSGITFFIDQEFNTAQYDFEARVCAFGAGQYALTPGRNEPCLFYVDFEDNIFVYYNLYIQTQPTAQFQDIVKSDAKLMKAGRDIKQTEEAQAEVPRKSQQPSTTGEELASEIEAKSKEGNGVNGAQSSWSEQDLKHFIHDSLYNVNRYEDEYQRLKRLADIERAKRAAFLAEEEAKARELAREKEAKAEEDADSSTSFIDPRLQDHHLYAGHSRDTVSSSGVRRHGPLSQEIDNQFDHHNRTAKSTSTSSFSSQHYTQGRSPNSSEDGQLHSPSSPPTPTSPRLAKAIERRRPSLLIKDMLSQYEGKVTPPLKSPISPTASSGPHFSKGHHSGALSGGGGSGSGTTLTNIMKRFNLKDLGKELGNGGRISRSIGGSSSSSGGHGSSTVSSGHHLLGSVVLGNGKTLDGRAGKSSLRVNRSVGVPRGRSGLGPMGRKLGAKSRLSHQQERDDGSEDSDEEGDAADHTRTSTMDSTDDILDREQMLDYERSQVEGGERYGDGGLDDGHDADLIGEGYDQAAGAEDEDGNENEDDNNGAYTPSTISPIPSPGRFYGNSQQQLQHGVVAEPSPSLDGSAFALAKSLLSPSANNNNINNNHNNRSGAPTHSYTPGSSSSSNRPSSRGHGRHRSGHGLQFGLGSLPTREISASVGIHSGPNSAGHSSSNQDGRRSRAESVLSTGSDIGGVIVPDITLLASSFPSQSNMSLSTSEPYSHGAHMMPDDSDDDGGGGAFHEGYRGRKHGEERSTVMTETGIRRPPRRSATLGSQDGGRGSGSGSDTTTEKPGSKRSSRRLVGDGKGQESRSGDVKLMPAPLPRSNQHYQRQQFEQQQGQGSSGDLGSSGANKDPSAQSSSHVSFTPNVHGAPGRGLGGSGSGSGGHGDGTAMLEGLGLGLGSGGTGTKASSTSSSANASEFGSGPSSPLTANVTSANAILSNPMSSSYKGYGILPGASPSAATSATTSASTHQYFAGSHYPSLLGSAKGAGLGHHHSHHSITHGQGGQHTEDDRMSIRSRASSMRGGDIESKEGDRDDVDVDSLLDHEGTGIGSGSNYGASPRSSVSYSRQHHQQQRSGYAGSQSSIGSTHLVSDSLVHRLEELQRQDHEMEERQRRKSRDKHHSEKERSKERVAKGSVQATAAASPSSSSVSLLPHVQQERPAVLSRVNSGASVQSMTSHRHAQSTLVSSSSSQQQQQLTTATSGHPPSSHGSGRSTVWGEDEHESARRLRNRLGMGQGL
ncbi:integrin alpha FG-GAP repeat-containing protein 2 [Podila epigama]|nr:integrin alpha FG-GAP repeat-containing protein 2 [Podila epigama]